MQNLRAYVGGVAALILAAHPALGTTYNYPADPLPVSLAPGDTLNVSAQAPFLSSTSGAPGSTVNFLAGGGV